MSNSLGRAEEYKELAKLRLDKYFISHRAETSTVRREYFWIQTPESTLSFQ